MIKSSEDIRDWNEVLLGEVLLLGVLSKVMQEEPERDWIESLIKKDIFSELPVEPRNEDLETGLSLLRSWSSRNRDGLGKDVLLDLRSDHTHLFVGVGKPVAAPWEFSLF